MTVSEAVDRRRSVRAFLDTPVSDDTLREVLTLASRAPSGGNLQPWHVYVINGDAMTRFRARMEQRLQDGGSDPLDYQIYPQPLFEPYRTRRFVLGEAMYEKLGIARDDKAGRLARFAENYRFFGAPAGLFCFMDRRMGQPQWSDLGMFLQTVMLLLEERGLGSCAQEAWSVFGATVAEFCGAPHELMLFCGMAIGHPDPDAPVNELRSERAEPTDFLKFV